MKFQIRRGIFETNSSSTHSLQFTKNSIDEIKKFISNDVIKKYGESSDESADFYEDGKVMLTGFDIPDGDEMGNVYLCISTWTHKIQFFAMQLALEYGYYTWSNCDHHRMLNFWDNSEIAQEFKKCVAEYYKSKGYDVKEVLVDLERYTGVWCEYLSGGHEEGGIKNSFKGDFESIKNIEELRELFNKIMDDDIKIFYTDRAYSPYEKPIIMYY